MTKLTKLKYNLLTAILTRRIIGFAVKKEAFENKLNIIKINYQITLVSQLSLLGHLNVKKIVLI